MFTIKIYYQSGQKSFWQCTTVNIDKNDRVLYLSGPGESGEIIELEGTEQVYIENAQGKTVDVIKFNH